jgi:hypothetical protein
MAPTKAETLYERMVHAFGEKQIQRNFEYMVSSGWCLLDYLTDEARDELLSRCITSHKLHRRFAAESRRHHARRVA